MLLLRRAAAFIPLKQHLIIERLGSYKDPLLLPLNPYGSFLDAIAT